MDDEVEDTTDTSDDDEPMVHQIVKAVLGGLISLAVVKGTEMLYDAILEKVRESSEDDEETIVITEVE